MIVPIIRFLYCLSSACVSGLFCLDGGCLLGLLGFGVMADGSVEGDCGGGFDLEGGCEGGEREGTEGYESVIKNERRCVILCTRMIE